MSIFATMRDTHPTIRFARKGRRNRSPAAWGTMVSGDAGRLLTESKPASRSKLETRASASVSRPMTTNQRGDSGNSRLRNHATMEPSAPSSNMTRHPKVGTNSQARNAETANPAVTTVHIMPDQRPRIRAGKNSAIMEYPTTTSAPSPRPMRNRSRMSVVMSGATTEASEAAPKMMRLSWYVIRRPYRSPRKPVRSAPNVIPTNVIEMEKTTLRQSREAGLVRRAEHARRDVDVEPLEEHSNPD